MPWTRTIIRMGRALAASVCLAVLSVAAHSAESWSLSDCRAEWDGHNLTIRNQRILRRWQIVNGLCRSLSLRDLADDHEYLEAASPQPAPYPGFPVREKCLGTQVSASEDLAVCVQEPALVVQVRSEYPSYRLTTMLRVFPRVAAVSSWLKVELHKPAEARQADSGTAVATGIESPKEKRSSVLLDVTEDLKLNRIHKVLGNVNFMDGTDRNDNLAWIREDLLTIASRTEYSGPLFYVEDSFSRRGLMVLKEAPLPHARPVKVPADLIQSSGDLRFRGLGFEPQSAETSYPVTVLLYQGGAPGRTRVLHDYQRCHRRFDPERDLLIWHSIWGDRNRDGRVCEDFLLAEMDRLHAARFDFIYFIDGWQKGASSNSVVAGGRWSRQWEQADYWSVNPQRFPHGLEPVVERARQLGIKCGMWYNPDSSDEYANWRRDTDVVLDMHRRYGINYIKFDGVSFTTRRGERNVLAAMHRVVEESKGRASIEIDITAGTRTGYFAAMPYGTLFLENRYTDSRKYYPHCTLRNLWSLAHWVTPWRLRVEFLNPERNAALYPNDPLGPSHYTMDYLFASVMFASPMAWLEMGNLSPASLKQLARIVPVYLQHRRAIAEGHVFPIGQMPNGLSWTGFLSLSAGERSGYLLVLREYNERPTARLAVAPLAPGDYHFQSLAGAGYDFDARVGPVPGEPSEVEVTLPEPRSYGFYRFERRDAPGPGVPPSSAVPQSSAGSL